MKRGTGLSPGCGTRRFASEIAAEKAVERGAEGVPTAHPACGGWHLDEAKPATTLHPGRDTGPDRLTREAVYERDGRCCVCCGRSVTGQPHSIGHRLNRSQGGSNETSNLLTFLGLGNGLTGEDDHHYRIDRRTDPHDEARGYSVRSGTDPATVPVMIHGEQGGVLVYLTDDAAYSLTVPERAA
jgi:5-methylcytosine-specific restriction endonuclease McrA